MPSVLINLHASSTQTQRRMPGKHGKCLMTHRPQYYLATPAETHRNIDFPSTTAGLKCFCQPKMVCENCVKYPTTHNMLNLVEFCWFFSVQDYESTRGKLLLVFVFAPPLNKFSLEVLFIAISLYVYMDLIGKTSWTLWENKRFTVNIKEYDFGSWLLEDSYWWILKIILKSSLSFQLNV